MKRHFAAQAERRLLSSQERGAGNAIQLLVAILLDVADCAFHLYHR